MNPSLVHRVRVEQKQARLNQLRLTIIFGDKAAIMTNSKSNPGLTICGLTELHAFQDAAVTHVLSILDPGLPDPADFARYAPHRRLILRFNDILAPEPGQVPPERQHIESLLEFGSGLAVAEDDKLRHLLVHCHAGISRSTAATTILMAEARPGADEDALFEELRAIRPRAWPNSRMIVFADELLGKEGRLIAALRRHYGVQARQQPDLSRMIEEVGRGSEVAMAL
jgi:predicted protein tyrosine phosphatase